MKTLRILVFLSLFFLFASSHSQAAPLYLTAFGLADLSGLPLDVTYNSAGGAFHVQGSLQDFIDSLGNDTGDLGFYGSYSISATINGAGVVAPGGTVTISDYASVTLLTGNLVSGSSGVAWGYDNNSSVDQFAFLFTVTGGTEAADFGGLGGLGGVNLFADFGGNAGHDTPFTGTWGGSFNNLHNSGAGTGNGYADIVPVPELSSILLTLVGGVLCVAARRRLNPPRA